MYFVENAGHFRRNLDIMVRNSDLELIAEGKIPPVDRGRLDLYEMGELKSTFDVTKSSQYKKLRVIVDRSCSVTLLIPGNYSASNLEAHCGKTLPLTKKSAYSGHEIRLVKYA